MPDRSRLLFVCETFHPDEQSTSQLFSDLLSHPGLERAWSTTVVTGHPSSHRRKASGPLNAHLGAVRIDRVGLRLDPKRGVLHRLGFSLGYVFAASWAIVRMRKGTTMLGVTNPPFTPVWLWGLSLVFRFRYHLMLLDVYPDGLEALGSPWWTKPIFALWRAANRRSFRRADSVLLLGRDMVDLIHTRYGIDRAKLHYLPHWSAAEPGKPVAPEETRLHRSLGLEGRFIVQYSGNMGLWHDMDSLVRAARIVQDRNPAVCFLFIGDGRRRAGAEALARSLAVENIRWLPFQPRETLSDSLACCHLALISQRQPLYGVAVPCKIYGILATGRGFLAAVPTGSEIARVAEESGAGRVVDPERPEEMAAGILELARNPREVARMGAAAFEEYTLKYRTSHAVEAFLHHFKPESP